MAHVISPEYRDVSQQELDFIKKNMLEQYNQWYEKNKGFDPSKPFYDEYGTMQQAKWPSFTYTYKPTGGAYAEKSQRDLGVPWSQTFSSPSAIQDPD